MKKTTHTSILIGLCLCAMALIALTGAAHSAQTDLTAILHEAIDNLTPGQQAALLVLLEGFKGTCTEEAGEAPQSAKDAILSRLSEFEAASEAGTIDVEFMLQLISEDFSHWGVNGREGAVEWIEMMAPSMIREGRSIIEIDVSDMEVQEEGDTAIAYPISVNTPVGSALIEIEGKREADGVWRIVGVDGL